MYYFTSLISISPVSCGGDIIVQYPGFLTSPGYPSDYPPYESCLWVLRALQPGHRLLLSFDPLFDLDVLTFSVVIYATVVITPFYDPNYFNILSVYSTDSCSVILDEQTGYLESPGHPGLYGPDLMCNYTITSVPPFQVHMIFSAFQLEGASHSPSGEPSCTHDSLEIWDGRPLSGKLIGRYCGDHSPGEVQSSRGVLSLLFATNGNISAGGFKAIYYQVDFGTLQLVTAVATQGGGQRPLGFEQFVSKYRLQISADGINWSFLAEEFEGNTDGTTVKLQTLKEPVVTQFLRLHPQTWQGAIALRSEVYGCSITDRPCSQSLNMAAGSLPHLQLSASSDNGPHWTAPQGHLLANRGWVPRNRGLLSNGEWIQVDLGDIRRVGGLLLQGVQGEAKFTNGKKTRDPLFVQEFHLKYSKDGETWLAVFEGSQDADIPVLRTFPHQDLRWLRLYPRTWSSFGAGLRLDLLGCSVTGLQLLLHSVER
uniref:Uncharacterized protein n=1 Tax=Eptatretus burgeri TaxID=7764 RepID=A0A8C4QNG2_EPTBU